MRAFNMLGHCFGEPTKENMEDLMNWQNAVGGNAEVPPLIEVPVRNQKYIMNINSLWFIMVCEKRVHHVIEDDSDEVIVTQDE